MTTSLQQQLQRLALPQTSALYDSKYRASLLFDAKEAANKDRRTIYELGLSGLQELILINPTFQQFQVTLFNDFTIEMERSIEHSDVNELLNKNIRKFLQHLSPYFLIRPAHLCIEWLLRRFSIHEYNPDDLMALALPYHETNMFVKVLQTLKLPSKGPENMWTWLRPLKKPGLPLSKTAIITRAASNAAFFKFICTNCDNAIKELDTAANTLQAQINFFTSIIVGALDFASHIEEWHIINLLPSLLAAFKSDTIDYVSAAFVITAQLCARTKLKKKLCKALIERVVAVNSEHLQRAAVLLLIWIFDTQSEVRPKFDEKSLKKLCSENWFTLMLSKLAKENVAIHFLCKVLISHAIALIINKHEDHELYKKFLERLLFDIVFSEATAQHIIYSVLDAYVVDDTDDAKKDGNVITLDSDDEMSSGGESFQSWYTGYLRKLEHQYPTAFDSIVKNELSIQNEKTNRKKAIKLALAYRLKSLSGNAADIYESLYHHTTKMRLYATKTLMSNLNAYQNNTHNLQILKDCLRDRIIDDSSEIVAEILKLPTNDFIHILGLDQFIKSLLIILYKIENDAGEWQKLKPILVKHLTAKEILNNYDINLILLILMPILLPNDNSYASKESIQLVLDSALNKKFKFLQKIKSNFEELNNTDFKLKILEALNKSDDIPTISAFLKSLELQADDNDKYFQQPIQLTHFLLLAIASVKQPLNATKSLEIFKQMCSYCNRFDMKLFGSRKWQLFSVQNFIPLELFMDFILLLIQQTDFKQNDLNDWKKQNDELKLFLNIFEYAAERAFILGQMKEKTEWLIFLKQYFNTVFDKAQLKMQFLLNFYIYPDFKLIKKYVALRLIAFKILNAILNNKENKLTIHTIDIISITLAFNSPYELIRKGALETLAMFHEHIDITDKILKNFIAAIIERSLEIEMDHEQYPLILYTILKPSKPTQLSKNIIHEITEILNDMNFLKDGYFFSELLNILKHINDVHILDKLLPLGYMIFTKFIDDGVIKILNEPYSHIYQLIIERIDYQNLQKILIDKPEAWRYIENIFSNANLFILINGKLQPLPCKLLDHFDENIYDNMPSKYQSEFLKLIIKIVANAESDVIFPSANKLLKRCTINCAPLMEILEQMTLPLTTKSPAPRKSIGKRANTTINLDLNTMQWKEGISLLELLDNKKKLINSEKLVPALFELLKICLDIEEQSAVEYATQLILSTLRHCFEYAKIAEIDLNATLPKATVRIDLIVQCVRISQNPQTHQNALLLLSCCAGLFPQQVLHNIVSIFTFMGSSVVRHDDAFSFHIINTIIESIIPIVIAGNKENSNKIKNDDMDKQVLPVLKVFADIMLDVPEHRRLSLYSKIILTLGAEEYLWLFLCIVFETHVLVDEKQRKEQKKSNASTIVQNETLGKRLEFVLELTKTYEPKIILQTCIELLNYLNTLPTNTDKNAEKNKLQIQTTEAAAECTLFDIKYRTNKQQRHYQYVIMQFVATISNSQEFLHKIALLNELEQLQLKSCYQNFIIKTLTYVPTINEAIELSEESSIIKFWKVLLHNLFDVLDNAISLLSPDMFLVVVNGLMKHKLLSIRKKVIELLIHLLQQKDAYFNNCNEENFIKLLTPLSEIVATILEQTNETTTPVNNELVLLQQTALIAIKLLSKLFALKYIDEFKLLLANLTKISKKRNKISKIVLATVLITMIEISSNLKAHSLAQLPKFMPQLLAVLNEQAEAVKTQPPDNVCIAAITGLLKLFESMPLFLGPYMIDIFTNICLISERIKEKSIEKDQRAITVMDKINLLWIKIANDVPARLIIPNCERTYNNLLSQDYHKEIALLMKLLKQSLYNTESAELKTIHTELNAFFMQALEFRLIVKEININSIIVDNTEMSIIDAFVTWILKLSETSFRPLYQQIYEWALKETAQKETTLTFFILTNKIVESLKSLFVLFGRDTVEDAARILNECNANLPNNNETSFLDSYIIQAILNTFYNIFLYDSKTFMTTTRFNTLLEPIVEQFENPLILENDDLQDLLTKCISQLAVSVSSDLHCKQLNHNVLLKTRSNYPEARILAFKCCIEIAQKLGSDEFTPLLPDTVPFIAELFEDENPRVEKNIKKLVQELENILGESLQKYL